MNKPKYKIVERYYNILMQEVKKQVKTKTEFVVVVNGLPHPLRIYVEDGEYIIKKLDNTIISDYEFKIFLHETIFYIDYILYSFVNSTGTYYNENAEYYEIFSFILYIKDDNIHYKYTPIENLQSIYRKNIFNNNFQIKKEQIIYKDEQNILMELFED